MAAAINPPRNGEGTGAAGDGGGATLNSDTDLCFLCGRPLGRRIEWHHPVPKSRGGGDVVPVHPICHRTIHATLTNRELADAYASADSLRAHPEIARFLDWIRDKDPDFHAPTRRRSARR